MDRVEGRGDVDAHEAEAWVAATVPMVGHLEGLMRGACLEPDDPRLQGGAEDRRPGLGLHEFEVPLTASLSARWPATVADVLAYDIHRGWLLIADAGEPLRNLGNPPERWLEVVPAYAHLQIGETEHAPDHLDAGVPDLRPGRLPERYGELLGAGLPLEPAETAALAGFHQRFSSLCVALEDHGLGATVQHDDLHMNNVYVKAGALRVLDWGDASISHPFFSLFETFRFLTEVNRLDPGDPWFGRLRDAYLGPWGHGNTEAFDTALRIAGFSRAIAGLDQRDALPEPERPPYDEWLASILRVAMRTATATR